MRDEEKEWRKTLEESDALIRRSKECLKKAVGKFLSTDCSFITPSDGEGSEKKMLEKFS